MVIMAFQLLGIYFTLARNVWNWCSNFKNELTEIELIFSLLFPVTTLYLGVDPWCQYHQNKWISTEVVFWFLIYILGYGGLLPLHFAYGFF